MADAKKLLNQRTLQAGDWITIEPEVPIACGAGFIVVKELQGTVLTYLHVNKNYEINKHQWDFDKGALMVGRATDNGLILPASESEVSRLQCAIRLTSNGSLSYVHLSEKNPINNPYFIQNITIGKKQNVVADKKTDKEWLSTGDIIPLQQHTTLEFNGVPVKVEKIDGNMLHYSYVSERGSFSSSEDLSKGTLSIGRDPRSKLYINDRMISGNHGEIALHEGQVVYRHLSKKNPIYNPHYVPPVADVGGKAYAVEPPVQAESHAIVAEAGGSGAGFTHENRKPENARKSNEDVGYAGMYVPLTKENAGAFTHDLIAKEIGPALSNMRGGSTLSMAMKTADGHFVGATLGDSPVFSIMQKKDSGDIYLGQVSIAHSMIGEEVEKRLPELPKADFWDQRLAAYNKLVGSKIAKDVADLQKAYRTAIIKYLGKMSGRPVTAKTYAPLSFTIDPEKACPDGYVFKGILACSDGVDHGVANGDGQAALKPLFANDATPTAEAISKAVVEAALPHTSDNVTAVALTKDAAPGDMIAVADGNTQTAAVAQAAIDMIRAKVRNKPVQSLGEGWAQGLK